MHKAMIATCAALATLLILPVPGSARDSQRQGPQDRGSYTQRSPSAGSYQRGIHPRGSTSQRSYDRRDGFRGVSPRVGYRGVYPHRSYRYVGYPHYRSNIYFGSDIWLGPGWGVGWPYYYPYYYRYYSAPPVVIEQAPTEYIERDSEPEGTDYLYHCSDPEGYYPDIERCPSGWKRELPPSLPSEQ